MTATHLLPVIPSADHLDDVAVVRAIGNTPLLRLGRIEAHYGLPPDVELWVKAEWVNPGGSIKDRPALSIIREALNSGELGNQKTLLDGTSGNMGIAYTMLGAVLGFPVELVLPYSASAERKQLLDAYGVTYWLSDPDHGPEGVQLLLDAILEGNPEKYYFAHQSANPANPRAHFQTTAPEIWAQTAGRITHFVCGLGTTGTIMGAGAYFKQRNPKIELIAAEAATYPHEIPGLKHLPSGPIPEIYDAAQVDRHVQITSEEAASATRLLAHLEGLMLGASTGAALEAAVRVGKDASGPAVIVLIAPDSGSKYLSTGLWSASKPSTTAHDGHAGRVL
jgi:cysteine synthase B